MSKSRKFYEVLPSDRAIEAEFNLRPGSIYRLTSSYVLEHWMCKGVKVPRCFPGSDNYSYARYCAVEEMVCGTYTGSDWTRDVRAAKLRRNRRWAFSANVEWEAIPFHFSNIDDGSSTGTKVFVGSVINDTL